MADDLASRLAPKALASSDAVVTENLREPQGKGIHIARTNGINALISGHSHEKTQTSCKNEDGTYTIDASVPSSVQTDAQGTFTGVSGEYRVRDITVGGEPIDLGRAYTVASHNHYLKNGGDGGIMSGECTLLAGETLPDVDCLAQYIESLGGSVPEEYRDPAGQGRITIAGR